MGLRPNFVLQACNGIKNCIATIGSNGFRYIIYDKEFIHELTNKTKTNWVYLSIFAHEVLHHLNNHTYATNTKLETRKKYELEADEWSGRICASLGATLEEAQAAMEVIPHPEDDTYSEHPTKDKRLEAIRKGFDEAAVVKKEPKKQLSLNDLTMERNGIAVISSLDAITNFETRDQTIESVTAVGKDWFVFFTRDSVPAYRSFAIDKSLPFIEIIKKKELGKQVKSLNYFNDRWLVLFEDRRPGNYQALEQFPHINPGIADSLFSNGLMIKELAFDHDKWTVVLDSAETNHCLKQIIYIEDEFPYKNITYTTRDGYTIACCKYLQNKWVTVLQKFDGTIPRIVHGKGLKTTFPLDEMIEKDIDGYKIAHTAYDGRNWMFIMNKKI